MGNQNTFRFHFIHVVGNAKFTAWGYSKHILFLLHIMYYSYIKFNSIQFNSMIKVLLVLATASSEVFGVGQRYLP